MNFTTFVIVISAFTLGVVGLASLQVLTVEAYVPSIASIDYYEIGSIERLNITVFHPPPPAISSGHYISMIQVEVNGTMVDLPQTPQSTNYFVVQYSLGPTSDNYAVRARALCNIHGFSSWSSQVATPEYSLPAATLLITLATIMVVATARKGLKSTHK